MEQALPIKKVRLTEAQAAVVLGISTSTLMNRRRHGNSPAYIKDGHRIWYEEADIEAYLESRKVIPVPKEKNKPVFDLAEAIGL